MMIKIRNIGRISGNKKGNKIKATNTPPRANNQINKIIIPGTKKIKNPANPNKIKVMIKKPQIPAVITMAIPNNGNIR